MFSLRTIIDDIMLLVRNNNISESEDLSRAQIAAWILAYRSLLMKQHKDKDDDNVDSTDSDLTQFLESKTFELEHVLSSDGTPLFLRKTTEKLPSILDNDEKNIHSVTDQQGMIIQKMEETRKFFHRYRKYTFGELTWHYDNGYIYVQGMADMGFVKYITVKAIYTGEDDELSDEDSVKIPGWMIPDIKKMILQNELSFMLQRISDDDNNSTLDGIKPQPQTNEK